MRREGELRTVQLGYEEEEEEEEEERQLGRVCMCEGRKDMNKPGYTFSHNRF